MQKDGTAGGPMLQVNPQGSGYVWILFAAFFWSLLGVASKFCIAGGLLPLETAFWRAAIGCLCFIIHAAITGSWRVNVRDALLGKITNPVHPVEALAVMAVLEAAVKSSETGSTQALALTAEERALLG